MLQNSFYQGSEGVTFAVSGDTYNVTYGSGPGQANDYATPKHLGEGVHPASNYVFVNSVPSALTISFDQPVCGVGLFTVDFYNPRGYG